MMMIMTFLHTHNSIFEIKTTDNWRVCVEVCFFLTSILLGTDVEGIRLIEASRL